MISTNISDLIKSKALLAKNFHIQPSEIDSLPMWEYEMFVDFINQAVKEENEKQKKDMGDFDQKKYKKMSDPSYVQKMARSNMPNMSNIGAGSFKF